ncbi:hypothetical protein IVB30_08250 [Bradyrhizobium sp. 200]|uniref:hypothetical protein n=1 Tax=Bradyrhizobium sp. 200 TaxID=2782665 RepID=UPI001FFFA1A1|nr:hypothetical protein [Bradyrhizobium sp. 200]UPJ51324.1 hypothetical protein IVB30_08250 [Bradyrhizobium sp. 200]
MDELLHLDSPRAADTPEDGSDDLDRSRARIPSAACMRHIRMLPAARMSGNSCQQRGFCRNFAIRCECSARLFAIETWKNSPGKNGGPFDPPSVMQYRLVMKVHFPLARQRP